MFAAALEIEYGANMARSTESVKSTSAPCVDTRMIFFVLPARRSGRNVLVVWMTPMVFTLNLTFCH